MLDGIKKSQKSREKTQGDDISMSTTQTGNKQKQVWKRYQHNKK